MNHFPIQKIRAQFPALQNNGTEEPLIFFDGPGGTQMVQKCVNGMLTYITAGMANLHGTFPSSIRTDKLLDEGRMAVADFLNCHPSEVAFGQNMTSLAFSIARSLAHFITEGDEVVVTEQDHRANVDPWLTLAKDRGAKVKFIKLNPETYTLEQDHLDELITEKTKLVAVGLSSNVTGTVTDAEKIIARAKAVNAVTITDAVHAAPHLSLDFKELGCDILFCSAYKFFGPHLGIAVLSAELFEKLPVYKLQPAPQQIPDKLETGTQNHEAVAGLLGAISFIEGLGEGASRRERLQSGMHAIDTWEQELAQELEHFLEGLPGLHLYRAPAGVRKTPTFAFTIEGVNSREACRWFAENYRMCIADGHFYASTMAEKLGVNPGGGWIRIGLAPYNTREEVELFKKALQEFMEVLKKKS
ncbi:cysteine desulfurase-like protein [Nafulsella turpanensis]|uniref:cysteine desulfurase-like protein n=1 Tax=Nafulsella turpanensis TaxID=1265690 RepID=UPI000348681B|nr:cysteine desulfurase-like protein [Nafulsella turpanensis]